MFSETFLEVVRVADLDSVRQRFGYELDHVEEALALEGLGFQPVGRYVVMAKRLAKPSEELVPERSGTAVPVN